MPAYSGYILIIGSLLIRHILVFDETPVSLTVAIGAESHFRCRYPNSDGILWSINDISSTNLPDSLRNFVEVQDSGHTLTLTADPQLNMSSIRCVATFLSEHPISTSAVTLIIQGMIINVC